jgi:hypothetical protein
VCVGVRSVHGARVWCRCEWECVVCVRVLDVRKGACVWSERAESARVRGGQFGGFTAPVMLYEGAQATAQPRLCLEAVHAQHQ